MLMNHVNNMSKAAMRAMNFGPPHGSCRGAAVPVVGLFCRYDLDSGRPLAGYINFCSAGFDVTRSFSDVLEDAVHQVSL
jgi:hypothetical protein